MTLTGASFDRIDGDVDEIAVLLRAATPVLPWSLAVIVTDAAPLKFALGLKIRPSSAALKSGQRCR
jgi:hypothetical protein